MALFNSIHIDLTAGDRNYDLSDDNDARLMDQDEKQWLDKAPNNDKIHLCSWRLALHIERERDARLASSPKEKWPEIEELYAKQLKFQIRRDFVL